MSVLDPLGLLRKSTRRLRQQKSKSKSLGKEYENKGNAIPTDHVCTDKLLGCKHCEKRRLERLMSRMRPIIQKAANTVWSRQVTAQREKMKSLGMASLLTTEQAKNFLADRANQQLISYFKLEFNCLCCVCNLFVQ